MRFGLSILLNKSLLVGFFAGRGNMVLTVRTALQDVLPMNLADLELTVVLHFANEPSYRVLKSNVHLVYS